MAENNNFIFVDSNYLIALYNPSDSLHKKTASTAKNLKQSTNLFISNFIFLETTTVLSQRLGRKESIIAGNNILNDGDFVVIHMNENLHKLSWKIFQNIKNKNASFVDCSILAVMQFYNIKKLLTFDKQDFAPLRKKYRFSFI